MTVIVIVILTIIVIGAMATKKIAPHERAVIFRLGSHTRNSKYY